jgi:MFS transporter, DHA1 family, multidrug resistance protein
MLKSDTLSTGLKPGQKLLGNKGLIALIALLSAFVPLSTDLYLPALPAMTKYFHTPQTLTNLTLILFFAFFSAGTLFWGPLSDKYGRRPVLLIGLALYSLASVFCAVSLNIYLLIVFRILQAVGGSAGSAVATAVVKDVYSGRKRESVLALVQSMVVISPAVAPVFGALLLKFTTWKGIFVTLAVIGLIALAGAFVFEETLTILNKGTLMQTIGRLGIVLKNPAFTSLLILFSIANIAAMAFISSSTYIYQEGFKLSGQVYSYYFALNAVGMLLGPVLYMELSSRFPRQLIINICFAMMAASGLLVCVFGSAKPWIFAFSLLPSTIASSCIRPPSAMLMLEQQKGDSGSASSLIGAFAIIMGSVGMIAVSFNWSSLAFAVGVLNILIGLFCYFLWIFVYKKPFIKHFDEI